MIAVAPDSNISAASWKVFDVWSSAGSAIYVSKVRQVWESNLNRKHFYKNIRSCQNCDQAECALASGKCKLGLE